MINFNDTYIICNSNLVQKLRSIPQFKLDLGKSLLDQNKSTYNPGDVKVQKHHIFHNDILVKCGNIGSLNIYNSNKYKFNEICICNEKLIETYEIDPNTSLYSSINKILDSFFKKNELKRDVTTKVEVPEIKKDPEYVKPNKQLSEMTEAERIAFARNRV